MYSSCNSDLLSAVITCGKERDSQDYTVAMQVEATSNYLKIYFAEVVVLLLPLSMYTTGI